jgi:hypothetical protein
MTTTPTAPPAERYESAEEARAAHNDLLKELPEGPGPGTFGLVTEFIDRAVATGVVLDTPEDRKQVQGLIDYWAASLLSAARHTTEGGSASRIKPATTVLAQFDPNTIQTAAAAADAWLNRSGANRDLVRRLMLRLVRLLADGVKFDPVPAIRATMYDLDTPERVDAVVDGLAAAGVVRLTRAEAPELDRVALRSPELTTEWGAYKGWLAERRQFRGAVRAWDQAGRPTAALATGEKLEEARSYFDRDGLERGFLEQSRLREWQVNEKNRVLKWVFAALAGVAVVATVAAVWGWVRALEEGRRATAEEHKRVELEHAKAETIELGASADSTSILAMGLLLMTEDPIAVHAAKKVLIIQTLRAVLFAGKGDELESATENWKELKSQLSENDPQHAEWFKMFFEQTRKKEIEIITRSGPADREKFDALQTITLDLKQYIDRAETKKALDTIRPVIVDDICRMAERITNAASTGKRLSEVDAYRLTFWRLSSSSLLLVADDKVQKEFVDALRKWEDDRGKASPEIVESLKRGLASLHSKRKGVARSRSIPGR